MNIQHEDYQVTYDPETATITISGSFRLHTPDYNAILEQMKPAADEQPDMLTLDIRDLRFLNSSGINLFYYFVQYARKRQANSLVIKGSRQVPWQQKTLKNFEKLWAGLRLEIE